MIEKATTIQLNILYGKEQFDFQSNKVELIQYSNGIIKFTPLDSNYFICNSCTWDYKTPLTENEIEGIISFQSCQTGKMYNFTIISPKQNISQYNNIKKFNIVSRERLNATFGNQIQELIKLSPKSTLPPNNNDPQRFNTLNYDTSSNNNNNIQQFKTPPYTNLKLEYQEADARQMKNIATPEDLTFIANYKKAKQKKIIIISLIVLAFFIFGILIPDDVEDADIYQNQTPTTTQETTPTKQTAPVATKPTTIKTEIPEEKQVATEVTVDKLYNDLNNNALNASNTYKDMYVKMTGNFSNVDASGKYFNLAPMYDEWSFYSVNCSIDKSQIDRVSQFKDKETITVIGTITTVGEVIGYSLKVKSIL